MREVSPGVFFAGKLQLDQAARTVTFPGEVNMDQGVVEYLLVAPAGNAHESLLVTSQVQASDLHLAMLLLGAKGAGLQTPAAGDAPPSQLSRDYLEHAPKLAGDSISISVKWTGKDGKEKSSPVEDWLIRNDTNKPVDHTPWIYTGSMFGANGSFLAQTEGNFAAMVTNPACLINNPRKGADNDQIWEINRKVTPPAKTPIQITIQLLNADKPAADQPAK